MKEICNLPAVSLGSYAYTRKHTLTFLSLWLINVVVVFSLKFSLFTY